MKRRFALLAMGFLLAACGTVPAPRQVQNSFPIDKPFDAVWQSVIEVFAELSLPIQNVEKASGLVTTDWISFRGQKNTEYCDCGAAAFPYAEVDRRGKFNVYVKKIADSSCELKVNAVFESVRRYQTSFVNSGCVSTGNLEREILKRVAEKIK